MRGSILALAIVGCGGANATPPTLTNVQAQVFAKSCNFSGCHTGAGNNGLNLEGSTHAKLVNVPSQGAPPRILVVPGKPDDSYLYQKLTQPMPALGAQMPNTGEPLSADKLQLVREWVAAGANDD